MKYILDAFILHFRNKTVEKRFAVTYRSHQLRSTELSCNRLGDQSSDFIFKTKSFCCLDTLIFWIYYFIIKKKKSGWPKQYFDCNGNTGSKTLRRRHHRRLLILSVFILHPFVLIPVDIALQLYMALNFVQHLKVVRLQKRCRTGRFCCTGTRHHQCFLYRRNLG